MLGGMRYLTGSYRIFHFDRSGRQGFPDIIVGDFLTSSSPGQVLGWCSTRTASRCHGAGPRCLDGREFETATLVDLQTTGVWLRLPKACSRPSDCEIGRPSCVPAPRMEAAFIAFRLSRTPIAIARASRVTSSTPRTLTLTLPFFVRGLGSISLSWAPFATLPERPASRH